jgi:hypothetical protein
LRKQQIANRSAPADPAHSREPTHLHEIDLHREALIHFSSEDPAHPVEHMFDGSSGRGAPRWVSARPDATEELVIAFDTPQRISHVSFEVEDTHSERTQQIRAESSSDGGNTFRQVFIQEYTFSPRGATYECESLSVDLRDVTHLRLLIVPNKGGSGRATMTSLRLFS